MRPRDLGMSLASPRARAAAALRGEMFMTTPWTVRAGEDDRSRVANTRSCMLRTFNECIFMACQRADPDIDDRLGVPGRTLTSSRMLQGRRLGVFPLATPAVLQRLYPQSPRRCRCAGGYCPAWRASRTRTCL